MFFRENAKDEEDEWSREQKEAEARLKALEEQVRQGKLRKEEEKRRKKAAMAEAKEKELSWRLAAPRLKQPGSASWSSSVSSRP